MVRRKPEPQVEDNVKSKYGVAAEQFVSAWEESDSVKEVADRLNMPPAVCSARAKSYRDLGIPLKKMPRIRRKSLDIQALTSLIVSKRTERQLPLPTEEEMRPSASHAPVATERLVRNIMREVLDKIGSAK